VEDDIADLEAIIADWTEMKENITEEIQKLKDFEFDVRWKTRVINVPIAIEQIKDLIDEIFHQLRDRIQTTVQSFEDVVESIKILRKQPPVVGAGEPTGFARTINKAETAAGYIRFGFQETRAAFDAAKDVTELFVDITERVRTAEDVFLSQKNKRQRVKAEATRRVGKLHSRSAT
jgi:hypothetical protein